MVLLVAINAVPLMLLGLAWRQYRQESVSLSALRRNAFVAALIVNVISATVLLSFSTHGWLIASGAIASADLDRSYPVASMLGIGVASAMLAVFGRGASRLLLVGSGLLLAGLWYMAAIAASP